MTYGRQRTARPHSSCGERVVMRHDLWPSPAADGGSPRDRAEASLPPAAAGITRGMAPSSTGGCRVRNLSIASKEHLLPPAQHLTVSPRVLRHMRLRRVANEKGVHYAMELSGHRNDRYI
jgi:hypothetical protein